MGKTGGERRLEMLRFEKQENEPIIKGVTQIGREGVDWTDLAQDSE